MTSLQRKATNGALQVLVAIAGLFVAAMLSGCIIGGYSSGGGGHFFLFPSLGVIVLIVVLFAVLRRR